jgi:hypothetical protein
MATYSKSFTVNGNDDSGCFDSVDAIEGVLEQLVSQAQSLNERLHIHVGITACRANAFCQVNQFAIPGR